MQQRALNVTPRTLIGKANELENLKITGTEQILSTLNDTLSHEPSVLIFSNAESSWDRRTASR